MIELYLYSLSHHYISGEYNEQHEMLVVKYVDISVGCYENSYSDVSCLVGKTWQKGNWHVGISAVTGYKFPVIPMPMVGYSTPGAVSLEFNLIPGAVTTSIKFRL